MEEQTTILIVDDEPAGREALGGVLYSQGYQLLFADNGKDAFSMALEYTPDLVLLDVMMPNMDGFEVCRQMRSHPLLEEIPVVMVTALDDRDSRLKGVEAGADDFIVKPFDRVELRARVRTITRLNRYRRLLLEKARFAWVVDQAGEGYLILNASDQILYANPPARNLLGLPLDEQEPIQETFREIVEKGFHCEPARLWQDWGRGGECLTEPVYLVQAETELSQPMWLELKALSLPGGSVRNTLVRVSEINEQVYALLGRWNFHSFLNHKLRTPVSNLTFGLEILKQHAAKLPPQEVAEIASGMLESSKRLESEINDVMKFIHTPSMVREQPPLELSGLQQVILCAAEDCGITKLSINIEVQLCERKYVRLSRFAMETIFIELLENSKKFHPELDPKVEISIRSKGPDYIVITVVDDGKHLSPYQLAHATTPYFQAEKHFTGEVEGMGLGLATVATLVWGSNGDCHLANRETGEGVVVEITLPSLDGRTRFQLQDSVATLAR